MGQPTKGEYTRSELVGDDPKSRRAQLRDALEPAFYTSSTGERKIRALHQLGSCFMVSDTDKVLHFDMETIVPRKSQSERICELHGKKMASKSQGQFSDASISSAKALEPTFESRLHSVDPHEDLITALRVMEPRDSDFSLRWTRLEQRASVDRGCEKKCHVKLDLST